MSVNLRANPFYLNEDQVRWVEETYQKMSLDEKLGQLFIVLKTKPGVDEEEIRNTLDTFHQGGLRWQGGDAKTVLKQNNAYQKYSRIPVLVAGNCDEGGSGVLKKEGTNVASAAEAGAETLACGGTQTAYDIGYVSGREASAIGVNWMFNPVADIYKNWRNTIVNTRSFGSDVDNVIADVRAYIRGIKDADPNMACTCKHFPGDGDDELDPHLSLAENMTPPDEWRQTYGRVYQTMIDEGLEAIMTGQISLPLMSRQLRPEIREEDIMPASLSQELLQDLLRGEMGFNGLIVSDASHMIGMSTVMDRAHAVPACIAAGCDMFLFVNDFAEDFGYMKAGYENGTITEERLSDAVHRILGLKAHLHLNEESVRFRPEEGLSVIGCEDHHRRAAEAADRCITLAKDTRHYLPLDPVKKPNLFLVYVQSTPNSKAYSGDPVKQAVADELTRAGFHVTFCPNFYDLEAQEGVNPFNFVRMMIKGKIEDFKKNYDQVLIVINVNGYAQKNTERLVWSSGHSQEMPWYNEEVPTIAVSLNYTNHLIDIARVHTYVNAYGTSQEDIHALVEKLTGKSAFKGKAYDTVFCGRRDTRL